MMDNLSNKKLQLTIFPKSAAIITMYKCSAMCKDCCFSCSPKENTILTIDEIYSFIDNIKQFKTIETIIWTGGECTLLGENLIKGMEYAHEKGLNSRIVSNGWWFKNDNCQDFLLAMRENGLVEVNLSTGDQHQKYVPIEKVLGVARLSLNLGIRVLIAVEKTKNARFSIDTLRSNSEYRLLKKRYNDLLVSIDSSWISIESGSMYDYDYDSFIEKQNGCDSLYNTVAIDPESNLLACCGLTIKYMPEMHLGNLKVGDSIKSVYMEQLNDFMKQWLYVEGPIGVLKQVNKWKNNLYIPKFVHPCQACSYIFQNREIVKIIEDNYQYVQKRISAEFYRKIYFKKTLKEKLKEGKNYETKLM